jgi:hypothetical protein
MSRNEKRLGEMGITLPNLPTSIANYVPAKRVGNLVFTAARSLLSRDERTKASSVPT